MHITRKRTASPPIDDTTIQPVMPIHTQYMSFPIQITLNIDSPIMSTWNRKQPRQLLTQPSHQSCQNTLNLYHVAPSQSIYSPSISTQDRTASRHGHPTFMPTHEQTIPHLITPNSYQYISPRILTATHNYLDTAIPISWQHTYKQYFTSTIHLTPVHPSHHGF